MTDRTPLLILAALFSIIVSGGAPEASAQLTVGIELNRDAYLLYEPVYATVEVTNGAGTSFVLGGKGAMPWVTFNLAKGDGSILTPYQGASIDMEPTVIKAGQTIKRRVRLDAVYPLAERGNFNVRCSVYFPPLDRYFPTRPSRFDVHEGRTIWERSVGLASGAGGGFRKYSVLVYDALQRSTLYFRVTDESRGRVLGSFALGNLALHREPQIAMDSLNATHILFLAAPKIYLYAVIGPDGQVHVQEQYREGAGGRPTLVTASGQIAVSGGIFQDPNAPVAETAAIPPGVRSLSERPAGSNN